MLFGKYIQKYWPHVRGSTWSILSHRPYSHDQGYGAQSAV